MNVRYQGRVRVTLSAAVRVPPFNIPPTHGARLHFVRTPFSFIFEFSSRTEGIKGCACGTCGGCLVLHLFIRLLRVLTE